MSQQEQYRFNVIPLQGKYTVQLRVRDGLHNGCYIVRYAYDTKERANEVLGNYFRSLGQPVGIETDLAANYYRYGGSKHFLVTRLTSRKHDWNIVRLDK